MPETPPPLLAVNGLEIEVSDRRRFLRAVHGLDLEIARGETVALVGESGSGKSLSCLALLDLLPKDSARVAAGSARFREIDLLADAARKTRALRGRRIAMVFQDPLSALTPHLSIGLQLEETIRRHQRSGRAAARARALELLAEVGIPDPSRALEAHPFELSGGQRQRVLIAIALAGDPELLIADEPTTALDVTVQAQILELFARLLAERGMALLLVTHDLGVVAGLADRVYVLYAGRVVETGRTREVLAAPAHPYTRGLVAALPDLAKPPGARLVAIPGAPPLPGALPAGCAFAPRCAEVLPRCAEVRPSLRALPDGRHRACHLGEAAP